jgi:hypothetical protein
VGLGHGRAGAEPVDGPGAASPATDRADGLVDRRSAEPGREPIGPTDKAGRPEEAEEDDLADLLGLVDVTRHPGRDAEDRALPAADQLRERVAVAPPELLDEVGVA